MAIRLIWPNDVEYASTDEMNSLVQTILVGQEEILWIRMYKHTHLPYLYPVRLFN